MVAQQEKKESESLTSLYHEYITTTVMYIDNDWRLRDKSTIQEYS